MSEYNYILIYYRVVCPACESEFTSYEKYIHHVFEKHENQPSLRMKAKIIKKKKIIMTICKLERHNFNSMLYMN